jgi:hypothetical protein
LNGTKLKFMMKIEGYYFTPNDEYTDAGNDAVDTGLIPLTFAFDQNYPNPFNPATTFRFSVPSRSHVSLEIINILGQKVATLSDSYYSPGIYDITWNTSELASGIYFAKIHAGNFTATRKVVILK